MLGRLIYVVIIMAVLLAGAFAFDFLAKEPGTLTIDYNDRLWEFSLFKAAVLLVVAIVAILIAIWVVKFAIALIRFCLLDDKAFDGFLGKYRERKGLNALAKGLVALESGDGKQAYKNAQLAQKKLRRPELTRLLNAKSAKMMGEGERAAAYYKAMLEEPSTAFVGAQGLLEQALEEKNTDRALKLARKAIELKPKDEPTLETLFSLQSQKFDWDGARKTLSVQRRAKYLPSLEADRREAVLALAQSEDANDLGETEHARALAVEAAKLDPTNAGAVSTAVKHLVDTGSKRAASKIVQDSWRARPSAQLAAAYASIEPDESPIERRRRFEGLFSLHPQHPETRFLQAELALVAEDWGSARKAIEDLRETEPSARSCAIMAAIARGEGEPDHVIRGWLARALGAPRDEATDSEISHAAMLPLLIEPGASSDAEDAEEIPDEEEVAAANAPTPPDVPAEEPSDDSADPVEGTQADAEAASRQGETPENPPERKSEAIG